MDKKLLYLANAAKVVNGDLQGNDTAFNGVSIDSRTCQTGDLFVAFKGERLDGHDFVAAAKAKGAVATIVERQLDLDLPQIIVREGLQALTAWADYWRVQHPCPLIAVTGSCGKTTTRMLMGSIMRHVKPTLCSEKSFNNHIGVPLVLSRLREQHQAAVLEIGANHHGEITQLVHLARPQVAMITMIGPVHLEGFGDLDGVAKAKGEIFSGLSPNGVAVIPVDSPYEARWRESIGERAIIRFGFSENADVSATNIVSDQQAFSRFTLVTPLGDCDINLPLLGQHNISNALAAVAACINLGADLSAIKQGLEQSQAEDKRLRVTQLAHNVTIIDDSYNANAAAAKAAIDVLAHFKGEKKILVLGDMGELGEQGPEFHRQVGQYAKAQGISELFGYGPLSQHTVESFAANAQHFLDIQALIHSLRQQLVPGSVCLIKGSRSMAMERIVQALTEQVEA